MQDVSWRPNPLSFVEGAEKGCSKLFFHMRDKTVVVTGGNSGIGYETALSLAVSGATTIITARNEARGIEARDEIRKLSGNDRVELACFDLSSLASVAEGAKNILEANAKIDVLVNNAGLVLSERKTSVDGLEMTFATNHLGPFFLTSLLLDRIKEAPQGRIVNVASSAHTSAKKGMNFDDLQYERSYRGMQAYGASKLANILFTTELARRIATSTSTSSATANSLHPGVVATGWGRGGDTKGVMNFGLGFIKPFVLTAKQGAATSIYLASSPDVADITGKYFVKCKEHVPSKAARDADAARGLWEISEQLIDSVGTLA
jgi:NAD(P)-dependent dehydrogenase (short-subunit alcohol dehydrogenase family)